MTLSIAQIPFAAIYGGIFDGTSFGTAESGFHSLDQYVWTVPGSPWPLGSGTLFIFGPLPTIGGGSNKAISRQFLENDLELVKQIHADPQLRKVLPIALTTLTPIEQRILTWLFPWLDSKASGALTVKEVGERYNLPARRIHALQTAALRKMVQNIDDGKLKDADRLPDIERLPILLKSWRRVRESTIQEKNAALQEALTEVFAVLEVEKVSLTALHIAKIAVLSGDAKNRARELAVRWRGAFDEGLQALQGVEGAVVLAQSIANQCYTASRPIEKARNHGNVYKKSGRSEKARTEFMKTAVEIAFEKLEGIDQREELAKQIAERAWIRRTRRNLASEMADGWKRGYLEAAKHLRKQDRADEIAREIADEVFSQHRPVLAARELIEARRLVTKSG